MEKVHQPIENFPDRIYIRSNVYSPHRLGVDFQVCKLSKKILQVKYSFSYLSPFCTHYEAQNCLFIGSSNVRYFFQHIVIRMFAQVWTPNLKVIFYFVLQMIHFVLARFPTEPLTPVIDFYIPGTDLDEFGYLNLVFKGFGHRTQAIQ